MATKAEKQTEKDVNRVMGKLFELYEITGAEIFREAQIMIFFFYNINKKESV